MKRFISVLLVMIITAATVLAFSACGNDPADEYDGVRFIYEDVFVDDDALETLAGDPSRYRSIISDDFGLGESGADNFYEHFEEHYLYGMTVQVLNYTGAELTITGLVSDSNGKNGVYIRKSINGGENGISASLPGSDSVADALTLDVLSANIELSDAQVIDTVKSMNFTLICRNGEQEVKYDLKLEDNVEITQGKESKAVVNLRGLEFGIAEGLAAEYASDKEKYAPILESTYGMSAKEAQKFLENPDGCAAYSYTVTLENISDKDIVIYDVALEKNGKKDVYAKSTLGGEMGLAAYDPNAEVILPPFIFNILCTDPDMIDSEVLSVLDSAKIRITYAEKTVSGDDMNDSVGEKKTVTVSIL